MTSVFEQYEARRGFRQMPNMVDSIFCYGESCGSDIELFSTTHQNYGSKEKWSYVSDTFRAELE